MMRKGVLFQSYLIEMLVFLMDAKMYKSYSIERFCTNLSLMVLHRCIGLKYIQEANLFILFFYLAFVNLGRIPHPPHARFIHF